MNMKGQKEFFTYEPHVLVVTKSRGRAAGIVKVCL
jgi:hypothetical protein